MSAAITAQDSGVQATLVEKSSRFGGAAAYSGGQVWVGANHVEARQKLDDSLEATLEYVCAAAARDASSIDLELARQWLVGAAEATHYLEARGVIEWEIIPDYPDYYYPDVNGSRATGRYLTGAKFDGSLLGEHRALIPVSPHFPVGVTYGEMFSWGGMSSRTEFDWELVRQRREQDVLTFGTGIAAALFKGVVDRGVRLLPDHEAIRLLTRDGTVVGVRCKRSDGTEADLDGPVILATGAHDWAPALSRRFTGIPAEDGGSVAPGSISGDAIHLVEPVGGAVAALPAWAAPVLPGYKLSEPSFEGDTGFRACYEHCLPHTFLVNRAGERFCDDSFHSRIVAAALRTDAEGRPANLPIFMIWDSRHHKRYGLGATMPGEPYPDGLVAEEQTPAGLASAIGVDPDGLERTVARFNEHATTGTDPDYGRGSNLSVRRFRGDGTNRPNPCIGAVSEPPFFGMRIRLLSTGIAAAGVKAGAFGRAQREDGSTIPGLHAVGECSTRAAAGVGYNSGYSLSRALAFGRLAALDIARDQAKPPPHAVPARSPT